MYREDIYEFYKKIDRSRFLDDEVKHLADYDMALPIGFGQTISQPSLVAQMTTLLNPRKENRVLEIGTGSGFQTAFLAEFSKEVYTVELIPQLSQKAEERLQRLGYGNIKYRIGDGSSGWPENAPYDRIIVTAGAGRMPEPLIEQLNNGGRMVIPVGKKGLQELIVVEKDMDGNVLLEAAEKVVFVELKGRYGWGQE